MQLSRLQFSLNSSREELAISISLTKFTVWLLLTCISLRWRGLSPLSSHAELLLLTACSQKKKSIKIKSAIKSLNPKKKDPLFNKKDPSKKNPLKTLKTNHPVTEAVAIAEEEVTEGVEAENLTLTIEMKTLTKLINQQPEDVENMSAVDILARDIMMISMFQSPPKHAKPEMKLLLSTDMTSINKDNNTSASQASTDSTNTLVSKIDAIGSTTTCIDLVDTDTDTETETRTVTMSHPALMTLLLQLSSQMHTE